MGWATRQLTATSKESPAAVTSERTFSAVVWASRRGGGRSRRRNIHSPVPATASSASSSTTIGQRGALRGSTTCSSGGSQRAMI